MEVNLYFNIYVTLADGVYYLGSSTGLYLAMEGSLSAGTPVKMLSKQTQGAAKLRQLWKIEYVEGGYYYIRSLYLATRALQVTSNTANITSISTSTNPYTASLDCRWIIETNSSGYIFKHRQSSTSTSSQCLRPSDTDVVTSHYVSGNSLFTWTLTPDTSVKDQLLLLDPITGRAYSKHEQYIIYGRTYSFSALKFEASFVSQTNNNQNIYLETEENGMVTFNDSSTTLTGVASGEADIYVRSKDSSQYASFKLIVIGPDQYSKGVRIATVDGKQYYDYTIPIDNVFEECVELCRENRCMNWTQYAVDQVPFEPETPDFLLMQATSFLWFYLKVKKGEEWDIKLEEPWRETIPGIPYLGENGQFVFRGRVESSADLGNIMYGYTGSATGFGESTLYWGGGIADDGDIFSEEAKNPPYYSESEEDHEHIELGIQLFHADYPDYPEVGFDGVPTDSNWLDEFASILFGGL